MDESMQSEESTRPSEAAPNGREGAAQKAKPAVETVQMPGTTAFPISKVSKIIKADRDVHMCQKEAVFLISCATEYFLKRITDAAYTRARIDKRAKSVLYKDLAAICSAEGGMPSEYFYLEDVVPRQTQTSVKPQQLAKNATQDASTSKNSA